MDIVFGHFYEGPSGEDVRETSALIHDGARSWQISVATVPHKDETIQENIKRHMARLIEEAFEAGKKAGS